MYKETRENTGVPLPDYLRVCKLDRKSDGKSDDIDEPDGIGWSLT